MMVGVTQNAPTTGVGFVANTIDAGINNTTIITKPAKIQIFFLFIISPPHDGFIAEQYFPFKKVKGQITLKI